MAILQIDLIDQTNDRRLWVSLRDNLPILDLIQKLVSDLELKQGEYQLLDEESGRALSEELTLNEEGIEDEHLLRLRKKKKIPVIIPVPIPPGSKVSAETKAPAGAEGGPAARAGAPGQPPYGKAAKPAVSEKVGAQAPKAAAEAKSAPAVGPRGGRLPPPPPRRPRPGLPRPGMPGPGFQGPGGFWHQPLRPPPFLRWLPGWIWVYFRPIILVTILLVMIICCLVGIWFCRITLISVYCPTPLPPVSSDITIEPAEEVIFSPMDAPYTFHNEDCYESLVSGQVEVSETYPGEELNYADLIYAFNEQEVVEIITVIEDEPATERRLVLVAFNEGYVPGSSEHYAWLRDAASGEDFLARINPEGSSLLINRGSSSGSEHWVNAVAREAVTYRQTEGVCWYYTAYFAFNTDIPPFDKTEMRQALVYSFDSEEYYNELFSATEGVEPIDGLVPRAVMQQELSPTFSSSHAPYDLERAREKFDYVKDQGWLADFPSLDNFINPTYCDACEGSDVETETAMRMWREGLDIGGTSVAVESAEHWQAIRGSDRQMAYLTYGHSNYYTFVNNAIAEGWIMLPPEGQARVSDLLNQYANAADLAQKETLAQEIDYLILEEYAAVLPLYYYSYCE